MSYNKQVLQKTSLKELENEIEKKEVKRKDEINDIKHRFKIVWIKIVFNPLTTLFLFAFLIAWIYYRNFNDAIGNSAIWLLEYFLIQYSEKK
jgi:hypothetical protein